MIFKNMFTLSDILDTTTIKEEYSSKVGEGHEKVFLFAISNGY